jgi:hypothetical protein
VVAVPTSPGRDNEGDLLMTEKLVFVPHARKNERKPGSAIQVAVNILGELADRFHAAARANGLSQHALALQCIEFAMSHMKETPNV